MTMKYSERGLWEQSDYIVGEDRRWQERIG